jgi:hypothetical protein
MNGNETSIPCPSIASLAAGVHEAGETITITGIALDLRHNLTRQENPYATFSLTDGRTGIKVEVTPRLFQDIGHTDAITGIPVEEWEGWTLHGFDLTATVTGKVSTLDLVPKLYATNIHIKRETSTPEEPDE